MSDSATGAAGISPHGTKRPSAIVRFMDVFSQVCLVLAGIALTLIVCINGANVFCRYVLRWALSWAEA